MTARKPLKLLLNVEVDCDTCYSDSPDEIRWLLDDILLSGADRLILHSNEIGDEIGTVKVIRAEVKP